MTRRALFALALAGCAARTTPVDTPVPPADDPWADLRADAAAGIDDPALADLLADHWIATMQASPTYATYLGFGVGRDTWDDLSLAGAEASTARAQAFLDRADALDTSALAPRDAMFLALFRDAQADAVASAACRFGVWSVSARSNALADLLGVLDLQDLGSAEAVDDALARLDAWAATQEDHRTALRTGLADGLVSNATSLRLVIEQTRTQLESPSASWPFLDDDVPEAEVPRLVAAIDTVVRPTLEAYVALLEDELLPAAPGDDRPGLPEALAGCYDARLHAYTGVDAAPGVMGPTGDYAADLHALGLQELERIHEAFRTLGPSTVGTDDLADIFEALRTDPALRFTDEASIVAFADAALRRAEAAVPAAFGRLPETPCVVREIPAHEAPYTTIAYYRQPSADGTKPGEYFVNTYDPTSRPLHEAEVLAFHESVPGHHLQIALSYELDAVPAFHRYEGSTAFVEGWALYTERLSDELGLYSSDTQRLGMLSFDAWRAARLVVDTGLHAQGWSREQAEAFFAENTPLARNNIANEVDRYITWPGQAVAYKVGQLTILQLREDARSKLGDRFDLSGFHDVVLGAGAVTLPVLEDRVDAWVVASREEP